jgi:hypothetical protein
MKTYLAYYKDKTGKTIDTAEFDAKNHKEACAMAQQYKKLTPKIRQDGKVRTTVVCQTSIDMGTLLLINEPLPEKTLIPTEIIFEEFNRVQEEARKEAFNRTQEELNEGVNKVFQEENQKRWHEMIKNKSDAKMSREKGDIAFLNKNYSSAINNYVYCLTKQFKLGEYDWLGHLSANIATCLQNIDSISIETLDELEKIIKEAKDKYTFPDDVDRINYLIHKRFNR